MQNKLSVEETIPVSGWVTETTPVLCLFRCHDEFLGKPVLVCFLPFQPLI